LEEDGEESEPEYVNRSFVSTKPPQYNKELTEGFITGTSKQGFMFMNEETQNMSEKEH
jgi:hypothetical protein